MTHASHLERAMAACHVQPTGKILFVVKVAATAFQPVAALGLRGT